MKVLYEICDRMEDELRQLHNKSELSATDLDNIYKMIDIVKDIKTVEAMKSAEEAGWSRDYRREYSRGYDEDYSNTRPIYYSRDDGYSYRRERDSMGRYSGHGNNTEMIENLKNMMMNARTEDERESYRKTIENLSR